MKEAVSASWEGFDPLPLLQMVSTDTVHTITNNNLSPVQMVDWAANLLMFWYTFCFTKWCQIKLSQNKQSFSKEKDWFFVGYLKFFWAFLFWNGCNNFILFLQKCTGPSRNLMTIWRSKCSFSNSSTFTPPYSTLPSSKEDLSDILGITNIFSEVYEMKT